MRDSQYLLKSERQVDFTKISSMNHPLRFSAEKEAKVNDFNYAIGMNRWSMKFLGLWPLDTGFSNIICFVHFTILFIFMLPPIVQLVAIANNWESIINQTMVALPIIPLFMRFIFIKKHTGKLRFILDSMIVDWINYRYLPEHCRRMMDHYAKHGRIFTISSKVFILLSLIEYTLMPVMNAWFNNLSWNQTSKYLPSDGFYPFPIEGSPTFELLYFMQFFCVFLYCAVLAAVDCLLCVIVFHACGQFDLLAEKLQRYECSIEHDCTKSSLVCACLSCIVKRHAHMINYMDTVETCFNIFLLVQLFGNCFNLATGGYSFYLFYKSYNVNGIIQRTILMFTLLYNTLIYCWIGEHIIEKSENIGTVAYNVEWYSFSRQHILFLILIMVRSRKPCIITAGRFTTMCLRYYKIILITLYSYIHLLIQWKKKTLIN